MPNSRLDCILHTTYAESAGPRHQLSEDTVLRHFLFWLMVAVVAIIAVIGFKWIAAKSGNAGLQSLAQAS